MSVTVSGGLCHSPNAEWPPRQKRLNQEVFIATLPNPIPSPPTVPSIFTIAKPTKPFHSKLLRWGSVILATATLAAGGALWQAYREKTITYETVPVERGSIQAQVTATGTLNPVVDVLVSSQVSGNMQALYADWNSKVKKGQLVPLIDPEILQAQVNQATARFRSTQAATLTAQAQLEKAKSDLTAAIANEKNAEAICAKDLANEANAKAQWDRADELFREDINSAARPRHGQSELRRFASATNG